MKKVADLIVVVAVISLGVGIISRLTMTPVFGIFANAFLSFAGVCLLLAIFLHMREK